MWLKKEPYSSWLPSSVGNIECPTLIEEYRKKILQCTKYEFQSGPEFALLGTLYLVLRTILLLDTSYLILFFNIECPTLIEEF
jgi:hypothetical protein